jgi:hypothetical protein
MESTPAPLVKRTPPRVNTAQEGSLGSPLVKNDPKLTLRSLNKLTSMRAHPTLNATNNINDNNNNNNNNINEENSEENSEETTPNRRPLTALQLLCR